MYGPKKLYKCVSQALVMDTHESRASAPLALHVTRCATWASPPLVDQCDLRPASRAVPLEDLPATGPSAPRSRAHVTGSTAGTAACGHALSYTRVLADEPAREFYSFSSSVSFITRACSRTNPRVS